MKRPSLYVLFGIMCLVTACGGAAAGATRTPPLATIVPAPTAGSPGGALQGNPADLIKKAQQASLQAKTLRVTTTQMSAAGKTNTFLLEYVNPDRVHERLPNGNEYIVLRGQGTWVKSDKGWIKGVVDLQDAVFKAFEPDAVDKLMSNIVVDSVTRVGEDALDGKPMVVYQYNNTLTGTDGKPLKATSKLWINPQDGRTHRIETISDSFTVPGGQDKTNVVYEYDLPLQIEVPK